MTRTPDFDELLGDVVEPGERDRLRHVHDLLVLAGPPPELPPQVEAGPTLGMTLGRRTRRHVTRRVALLAAAVVILLVAFLLGYITGNDNGVSGRLLELRGTSAAPRAQATLRLEDRDEAGNWAMQLGAFGLPKVPEHGYYEVFLVRNGRMLPCGAFVVRDAKTGVSVQLNAPYRLRDGDTWVVTQQRANDHGPGPVVLRPVT